MSSAPGSFQRVRPHRRPEQAVTRVCLGRPRVPSCGRSKPVTNIVQVTLIYRLRRSAVVIIISVIVGSTRQGRFSEKPARWIFELLRTRDDLEARFLDLRDYPMPFFDQPLTPSMPGRPPYEHVVVKKWTAAIAESDGFVVVTPEYNHGVAPVLKNALDWVYPEWNRKAVAFVAYGNAAGARSVEHLRATAIELQLAPIRSAVHIPVPVLMAHYQGGDVEKGLAELERPARIMIDDLLWWTAALKAARAAA